MATKKASTAAAKPVRTATKSTGIKNNSTQSAAIKNATANQLDNLSQQLQYQFGFDGFKGPQEKIIESLLSGKDTFVIMPTGGGKSLCYQLPAIISEGVAIIVSPLIALMKNQVDLVRSYSSKDDVAHFLNSTLNKAQQKVVKEDLTSGPNKNAVRCSRKH